MRLSTRARRVPRPTGSAPGRPGAAARWAALAAAAFLAAAGTAEAARPRVYAVKDAEIHVAPGRVIEKGTLVIRDGLIQAVGASVEAPPDAEIVDGQGKILHAGFIDGCSRIAVPEEPAEGGGPRGRGGSQAPEGGEEPGAFHPIDRIRPERRVLDTLKPSSKEMAAHREMGFTAALVVPDQGIFRGTSALVAAGDGAVSELVIRADVAQHVAFERGRFRQPYPTSLMGAIAAIRQGLEDARRHEVWQARYDQDPSGLRRPDTSSAWAHLARVASGKIPAAFQVDSAENALRALALADEFDLRAVLIGSGQEDRIVEALKRAGVPVILPLSYPDKPDLDDEGAALEVETRTLREFLEARANPGRLAGAGIPFALGTCGMKQPGSFPANLREALKEGLAEEAALEALTTAPARFFGVERALGTLEAGKAAHVVLRRGGLFDEEGAVERVWVDGVDYPVKEKTIKGDPDAVVDPRGEWEISFTFFGRTVQRRWTISGEEGAWTGRGETGQGEVEFDAVELKGNALRVSYSAGGMGTVTIDAVITGDEMEGTGETPGGRSFEIRGTRREGPPGESPGGADRRPETAARRRAAGEGGAR